MANLDRARLSQLLEREQAAYTEQHPGSRALFEEATNLFGRVPMTWMNMWSGGFPLYLDRATGNRVTDVDGQTYVDFCLGDTGAMAGHSPAPTVAAAAARMSHGITTMLPSEDARPLGEEGGQSRALEGCHGPTLEVAAEGPQGSTDSVGDRRRP